MNPGRGWLGIGISTDGFASPIAIHGSLSSSPPAVGHKEGTVAACGARGRHDGGCLAGQEERAAAVATCAGCIAGDEVLCDCGGLRPRCTACVVRMRDAGFRMGKSLGEKSGFSRIKLSVNRVIFFC
jgi:hypothetical protein